MAQTLLSTSPVASPNSRTTLSSRSVGTPLDFFGQATQSPPAVVSRRLAGPNRAASARRSGAKASTTSYGDRPARRCTSTSGSGPSVEPRRCADEQDPAARHDAELARQRSA